MDTDSLTRPLGFLAVSSVPDLMRTPAFILTSITLMVYSNALLCGFVFDDISAIKDNKDLRHWDPFDGSFYQFLENDFWGIPMMKEQSHKSYRPLCVLSYRLNYLLHGLDPIGYHLVNILLHSIATLLFYSLLLKYIDTKTSLLSCVLFAVHPIHTEAVTGVVGRAELLSCIFFLLALLSHIQSMETHHETEKKLGGSLWRILLSNVTGVTQTGVLTFLAMLSKEQGITVIGLCVALELFQIMKLQKWLTWIYNGIPILPREDSKPLRSSSTSSNTVTAQTDPESRSEGVTSTVISSFVRIFLIVLMGLALLVFRIKVMQGSSLPVFTRFDNPARLAEDRLTQFLTTCYLPALNTLLLLAPSSLCCDWTMGSIPLLENAADPRNLATLAVVVYLLLIARAVLISDEGGFLKLLLGVCLLIIPFIPASNLFFPVGFVIAERVLYIPSMGFSMLVALGYDRLQFYHGRSKNWIKICLGLLIVFHSLKTIHRNLDWKDEESIFLSGLKVNSRNAKLFNNVGHALESKQKYNDSLVLFKQAAIIQPDDIGAHINIGRTLNHLGRYGDAEQAYRTAKTLLPRAKPGQKIVTRIAPNSLNLFLNLGNLIAKNSSRLEEADKLYRQAIAMRSDYIQAYINRGDILIKLNRTEEAKQVYKEGLKYDRENPDLYYNLGVVAIEQDQPKQGLEYMNTALEYNPQHTEALLNSAILIQELGLTSLYQEAKTRLLRLVNINPDSERGFFNLGMLTMDQGWAWEAEHWFKKAIEVKPSFRGALFNLALLLTDQHKSVDAVPHLLTLLQHYPDHIKGLTLLGDIYTNILKELDKAENCYKRILELDPGDVQARHNLCVLEVERGHLEAAESCLEKVIEMAPQEQYIRKHLNIVRKRLKIREGRRK